MTVPTLEVQSTARPASVVDHRLPIADAPIGSGDVLSIVEAPPGTARSNVTLRVLTGSDAGQRFQLGSGVNTLGRDAACTVVLTDPMVSGHHAKLIVTDVVEVLDDNSTNGILSSGENVQRLVLGEGGQFTVGDSTIAVEGTSGDPVATPQSSGVIRFNRSPRLDPTYVGKKLIAPDPPQPRSAQRFPLITAIMPLFMGVVLFAVTKSVMSILFVGLSPLMLIGGFLENKRSARNTFREQVDIFEGNLAALVAQMQSAHDDERAGRIHEQPSTSEVVTAVKDLGILLWTRRPEHESFLSLRLGLGTQPSRLTVEMPSTKNAPAELNKQLDDSVVPFENITNVPVACEFTTAGSLGVSGPEAQRTPVARGLIAQLVGLHSPVELVLAAVASTSSASRWDWIKWIPHVNSDFSPLNEPALASEAGPIGSVIAEINGLIESRQSADQATMPIVVLLVENDAPIMRSALTSILEHGPAVGVHIIWLAETTSELPAACRTYLELSPNGFGAATGKVTIGERVEPVVVETLDGPGAEWFGRRLACVVDAGFEIENASDIPASVSLLAEAGLILASETAAVVERWTESNSLHNAGTSSRAGKRDNTLRALVGRTGTEAFHLDLRSQGPHALVGGTTGAGKSEFLQTWILGMAAAHSPQRVTFLFIDYKGGAAFADCIALPHSVGLVTDLSPHLVQRALRSLNAELRYREHLLNSKRAKDLLELERRGDPDAPPSLVIVVDEFAALVQEVPEFVDGVVNVAQRGRSLGLHLILATQRPTGVIKGNLRANTNLRVALRMADEDDSTDVVGTSLAATFDPAVPGRAIAKTGPGRLTMFQTGYVGGVTLSTDHKIEVRVHDLVFGQGTEWEFASDSEELTPMVEEVAPDIHRLVESISRASAAVGIQEPRRPWLPELAEVYDLAGLPTDRTDSKLVFGVVDHPDDQAQGVISFDPDIDGSMVIYGSGGSGKSTALRSIASAAGLTARGGPCHVYGLDFGSRGLSMLEVLPHVGSVISGDDFERTARLLRQLKATLEERAVRYSKVSAATIEAYRKLAAQPDEPRILLLLDGIGAFRSAYETGINAWMLDTLHTLSGDGRPLGIHVVATADRVGAVPSSLASVLQKRLALRLSGEMDLVLAGVPKGGFGDSVPAGRGFMENQEIQVAVFGGIPDSVSQSRAIDQLAGSMRRAGVSDAPVIARLPEKVHLSEITNSQSEGPIFAVADESLSPIWFDPSGLFVVAGPTGSGRTTALRTMVASLRQFDPEASFAYLGVARSPLATDPGWVESALGPDDCAVLAERLADELRSGKYSASRLVVVLDGIGEFLNSTADYALQELLKLCRTQGVFVLVDGETGDLAGSWPLLQAVRASRYGLVLQPDQVDGDMLFRVQFGRMSRADFPAGRGMFVRQGRAQRVQVALPQ